MRKETDSLGEVEVPSNKYWGAQTQRSIQNFKIGSEKMPIEVIKALAIIKLCAARTNEKLNILPPTISNAIQQAAQEIINNKYLDNFPLKIWQTGSGTQTNMNINEVISNRAIETLKGKLGTKNPVHPNDHVNKCQSSNDSFPTAMHIATVTLINQKLLPALQKIYETLKEKSYEFADIIKIGRTHLQDATPITMGQEFSCYATQMQKSITRVKNTLNSLYELAQGGTAVGTGINAPPEFAKIFIKELIKITNLPFTSANNKFEGIASHDAILEASNALNNVATSLMKIANDIRLLGSGPRCGLGEIHLPTNEPGSSIMPGKINPTQCEALTMVCAQVMGNNVTISIANSHGHLQLNTFKPVIIYNIIQSINIISDSCISFSEKCIQGIKPNIQKIHELCQNSLMLVTALNPHIGYDNAAKIAKTAYEKNITLKEAASLLNILSPEKFDKLINLKKMI